MDVLGFLLLVLLLLAVLAAAGTALYLRTRPPDWWRRKRVELAVQRAEPGPQRDAAKLRLQLFDSVSLARELAAADAPNVVSLVAQAQLAADQLDRDLLVLSRQRDRERVRVLLAPARERVERFTTQVEGMQEMAGQYSRSMVDAGLRQLEQDVETTRQATQAGLDGVGLGAPGLDAGTPMVPVPAEPPPVSGPPPGPAPGA